MPDLDAIFKAYDIRGTTPDQLDAGVARAVGEAFAVFVRGQDGGGRVLVGRDMRPSGVELAAAFSDGVRTAGVHGGPIEPSPQLRGGCCEVGAASHHIPERAEAAAREGCAGTAAEAARG